MKCGAYVGMLRTIVLLGGFTDIHRPSRFPSSKSPRRTLPTVAEAGNVPIDERYQLGDWINASMQGKRRRIACSSFMPLVYAATETKIASQLDLKTWLLDAVQAVVDTIPAANLGTELWEGEVVGLLRQRLAKGFTPPSPVNKPLRSRSRTLSSRPSSSSISVSNSLGRQRGGRKRSGSLGVGKTFGGRVLGRTACTEERLTALASPDPSVVTHRESPTGELGLPRR